MHGNRHKIKGCKKRNHKRSSESLSSKVYDSFILRRKILVLALHCYCRYSVKYGLLQKRVSKGAPICRLKKFLSNEKLLQKVMPFSYHME